MGHFNHVSDLCGGPSFGESFYRMDCRYLQLLLHLMIDQMKSFRSTLLAGLVTLVGGTLLFCLGHGIGLYIVARFLQGISSAIVWIVGFNLIGQRLTTGLAMIADTVNPNKIGRAMTWISIQLNLGLTLGPLLGGIVYDRVGWYGTFALGFGFLGLDILLRIIVIEKRTADRYRPNEENEILETKEDEDRVIGTSRKESRIPEVIHLLRFPRLLAGMWLTFTEATIISAFDAMLPLHLNELFGWTAFQAGKCL